MHLLEKMATKRENKKEELKKSHVAHQKLLSLILKYSKRMDGNQWKIIKFHMITHVVLNIVDFGVPLNIDTSAPESNHKYNMKKPSSHTSFTLFQPIQNVNTGLTIS